MCKRKQAEAKELRAPVLIPSIRPAMSYIQDSVRDVLVLVLKLNIPLSQKVVKFTKRDLDPLRQIAASACRGWPAGASRLTVWHLSAVPGRVSAVAATLNRNCTPDCQQGTCSWRAACSFCNSLRNHEQVISRALIFRDDASTLLASGP